jgi:hypothetical protein
MVKGPCPGKSPRYPRTIFGWYFVDDEFHIIFVKGDAKPCICVCCGNPFESNPQDSANPHVCVACAKLAEDIQDDMIIQTAVPYEVDQESDSVDTVSQKEGPSRSEGTTDFSGQS